MRRVLALCIALLTIFAANVSAQNQDVRPRIRISFDGSTTLDSLNMGGWARWRTSGAVPPVSAAGEARIYFDGTKFKVSENGGAYVNLLPVGAAGTVTSVALTMPGIFAVGGSPITTNGTLAVTLQTQTANTVFAGPTTGGALAPTFRALVTNDIPTLDAAKIGTGTFTAGRVDSTSILDGTILFADINANSCGAGAPIERNAGNTAWVCGTDDTSPGGTAWTTNGNVVGAGTAVLGSTDAFGFNIITGGTNRLAFDTTGNVTQAGGIFSAPTVSVTGTSGTSGYVQFAASTAAVSATNTGRFRYNGTTDVIEFSVNGGAYQELGAVPVGVANFPNYSYVQWRAADAMTPDAAGASLDVRNNHTVLLFAEAATESAYFEGIVPREYDGGSVVVSCWFTAVANTTNNARWLYAFENMAGSQDIDADGFGTEQNVTATPNPTAGIMNVASSTFTNTAADSITAGSPFRLRVRREPANAGDTTTADLHITNCEVRK